MEHSRLSSITNGLKLADFVARCTMAIVSNDQRQRRFRATVLLVATISLLLLLLSAHPADHHNLALVGFVLIPLFLFGRVVVEDTMWLITPGSDVYHFPVLTRPSLFQRPPPTISA